jgi:hypothetical protein
MKHSTHEIFESSELVKPNSDRNFGLVMAAVFAILSLVNGLQQGHLWPLMISLTALFGLLSWLRPVTLQPINVAWTRLGVLLHRIVNPFVMGLIFYGAVLPTGLVMRMRGHDLLRLKLDPNVESYWITREPGPDPETLKDQF